MSRDCPTGGGGRGAGAGVELRAGFFAVDRETGTAVWEFTPGPIEGYLTGGVFSTPVVADGVVYVAGTDGRLYAIAE